MSRRLHWVRSALDWRTLAVATVFLVALLAGLVILNGARAAHDSSLQQSQLRKAAARRIDILSKEIIGLEAVINGDSDSRGRLLASIDALREQVRQLGGVPVVVASPTAPAPAGPSSSVASPSAKAVKPSHVPKPAHSPKPSPTCTRLTLVPVCL